MTEQKRQAIKRKLSEFSLKDKIFLVAALILCGMIFLGLSSLGTGESKTAEYAYSEKLESSLCRILSAVDGVGEVEVLINVGLDLEKSESYVVLGVAVAAQGADNVKIKAVIIDTVKTVLDISANRITVVTKK